MYLVYITSGQLICEFLATFSILHLCSPNDSKRSCCITFVCDFSLANQAQCATLKPRTLRILGEYILSTVVKVGVAYCQTGKESLLMSEHGGTYDQTLTGVIGLIFAEI